jgi:acyl carrier protein
MSVSSDEVVRRTLLDILSTRLQIPHLALIQDGTDDVLGPALEQIDSPGLLDIILEVEQSCGVVFNPERIDFDSALSIDSLTRSFESCENANL